ncbi:FtsB family cell division protein [Levilactobacillus bambusae]|uniref:Dihydroorotate dehydrogenase n=1 Tax=Levilactobacillus bambusae TaxID=2024736 RepID=A0A2V1MXM2_9LACO|nr:septum formation initiator family protein [Levilactobacillus bambusae]PWF99297.1 dihydroorotate dehydrogenase [Levilactobacillus bambusae]
MDKKPGQIEQLNNDYTRHVADQVMEQRKRQALMTRRRRRALKILAVFAVAALFFTIQLVRTNASYHHVQQQVKTTKVKLADERKTNADLKGQIKDLNDDDYLAKLIRSKYYYTKSGETVYSLPSDRSSDVVSK